MNTAPCMLTNNLQFQDDTKSHKANVHKITKKYMKQVNRKITNRSHHIHKSQRIYFQNQTY